MFTFSAVLRLTIDDLCFACRVFQAATPAGLKEAKNCAFTTAGYKNWANAMSKSRGFTQHEQSENHVKCMEIWETRTSHIENGTTIASIVSKPDPEHKTYMRALFVLIKFLVKQGLPLRGDIERTDFSTGDVGGGLFLDGIKDVLFELDPHLERIAKRLPGNSKYTSPVFQDEVIAILTNIVKDRIARECIASGDYRNIFLNKCSKYLYNSELII